MHGGRSLLIVAVAAAGLALVSCGDGNPASPSGAGGVTVQGVLLGEGAAFTSSSSANSSDGPITVVVEGTSISVTISGNGTFEIEDIPPGPFTLVFFQGDVEIGRITITAADGAKVKIVVKKEGSVIVLIDLKLDDDDDTDDNNTNQTCMIDGGRQGDRIELEGNVAEGNSERFFLATNRASATVEVLTSSTTEFKCNGNTAGSDPCPKAVQRGAKVHVRGTLNKCGPNSAEVTASQVKVQKAA